MTKISNIQVLTCCLHISDTLLRKGGVSPQQLNAVYLPSAVWVWQRGHVKRLTGFLRPYPLLKEKDGGRQTNMSTGRTSAGGETGSAGSVHVQQICPITKAPS